MFHSIFCETEQSEQQSDFRTLTRHETECHSSALFGEKERDEQTGEL